MLIAKINSFCSLGMPTPILMDWVVIAAYILASVFCFKAKQVAMSLHEKKHERLWRLLAISTALLGINKFLYFESCITNGFSAIARNYGWYNTRRAIQVEFILIVALFAACIMAWLIYFFKDLKKPAQCAVAAFALLLLLVMVRTISLHQIDALIFPDILGVGVGINWIIELVCNLAIASSAWVYFKSYKPTQIQAQ